MVRDIHMVRDMKKPPWGNGGYKQGSPDIFVRDPRAMPVEFVLALRGKGETKPRANLRASFGFHIGTRLE
jgi:hypothetical protein